MATSITREPPSELRHTCRECGARVMVTWDDATTMTILHERNGRYVRHDHQQTPKRDPAPREQGPCRTKRQAFDGEQLRRARKAHRLSATQLGLLIGASQQTVQRWEYGAHWPSDVMLDRLAEELPEALGAARERVHDREQAER